MKLQIWILIQNRVVALTIYQSDIMKIEKDKIKVERK